MKKLLPYLIGLIVLAGVAVVILIYNINPIIEKLRPTINDKITQAVGHPVELGELTVELFPSVGIGIQSVTLAEGDDLSVSNLVLETGLFSLLRGAVVVEQLSISKARVSITKEKDGTLFLGKLQLTGKNDAVKAEDKEKKAQPVTQNSGNDADASLELAVQDVEIRDVTVQFTDKSVTPTQKISLSDVNISVKDLAKGSPGTLDLQAKLLSAGSSNISAKGTIALEKNDAGMPLSDIVFELSSLDLSQVKPLLDAYAGEQEQLSLDGSVSLTSTIKIDQTGLTANGELSLREAQAILTDTVTKESGFPLSLSFSLNQAPSGLLSISDTKLVVEDSVLTVGGKVMPEKNADVAFASKGLSFESLAKLLPPLKKMTPKGQLIFDGTVNKSLEKKAKDKLPGGAISLSLKDFSALVAPQANISGLNLKSTIALPKASGFGHAKIEIIEGLLANESLAGSTILAEFSQDKVVLKPSKILIFAGSINAEGSYSKSEVPNIATTVRGSALDLSKISKVALQSSPIKLSGTIDKLATKARTNAENTVEELTAAALLNVSKGAIEGINIFGETLGNVGDLPILGSALIALVPEKYRPLLNASSTAFDSMDVTISVGNSVASIEKFSIVHGAYFIEGSGTAGFDGHLDIGAQLKLSKELAEEMVLKKPKLKLLLDKKGNLTIPIKIKKKTGAAKPIVKPDTSELAKNAASATIKEGASKALDKVAPGLGGALDSLF